MHRAAARARLARLGRRLEVAAHRLDAPARSRARARAAASPGRPRCSARGCHRCAPRRRARRAGAASRRPWAGARRWRWRSSSRWRTSAVSRPRYVRASYWEKPSSVRRFAIASRRLAMPLHPCQDRRPKPVGSCSHYVRSAYATLAHACLCYGEPMTGIVDVPRRQQYVAGKWTGASADGWFDDLEPYTGRVFARVPASTREDARLAVDAAVAAFPVVVRHRSARAPAALPQRRRHRRAPRSRAHRAARRRDRCGDEVRARSRCSGRRGSSARRRTGRTTSAARSSPSRRPTRPATRSSSRSGSSPVSPRGTAPSTSPGARWRRRWRVATPSCSSRPRRRRSPPGW